MQVEVFLNKTDSIVFSQVVDIIFGVGKVFIYPKGKGAVEYSTEDIHKLELSEFKP